MAKWVDSKLLIFLELGLAIFFLLGANVFGFIPVSETPFIVALALISIRLRKVGFGWLGFRRQANWLQTIGAAAGIAIGIQLLSTFVTEPLLTRLTGKGTDLSDFESIKGNLPLFLIYLGLIWTLAAFGEEISYRGFILQRLAQLLGNTKSAWVVAILAHAMLFGLGHFYQGPTGIVDTSMTALILGSAFYLSGRNLWLTVLAHGLSDTIGLVVVYLGWIDWLRNMT